MVFGFQDMYIIFVLLVDATLQIRIQMKYSLRKILIDPSFWVLLGVNIFLVYKYEHNPGIFTTLVWLYFSQNMLYGFFCFLDILTTKNMDVSGIKIFEKNEKTDRGLAISAAWGFLLFFSFFHLVYFVFLSIMPKSGPFQWDFFKDFLLVFIVFQIVNFIQHKVQNKNTVVKIGQLASLPLLRVMPMHLCILVPAFIHISNLTVFLVLKVIIDVITFVLTTNYYKNNDSRVTVANINLNSTFSDL